MIRTHTRALIGLTAALALSCGASAASPDAGRHDGAPPPLAQPTPGTPDAATPEQRLQAMQNRMQRLRDTVDPQMRMPLMEEQMADMEAMMQNMAEMCPMMSGTVRTRISGGTGGPGHPLPEQHGDLRDPQLDNPPSAPAAYRP